MSAAKLNHFFSKQARGKARRNGRRPFGSVETLERREMMAGDLGQSLFASISPTQQSAAYASAVVASAVTTNNTLPNATDMGVVQGIRTITESVGNTDKDDYYRFVLDEPAEVLVRLDQLAADADLAVYNSAGTQLGLSTRTGASAEQIALALNAGNYYARINYPSNSGGTNFRLTLDVDVAGESLATARNLGAAPANGKHTFTDWIGQGDAADIFRFNVTKQTQMNVQLDQLSGDADLYLYDGNGKQLGVSKNTGTTAEQLTGNGSGTFYVKVVPYGSAQAYYRLSIGLGATTQPLPTGQFKIDLSLSGFTTSQKNVFFAAAQRWEQVIIGDLPNVRASDGRIIDDLQIDAKVVTIDGAFNTLANAGPRLMRSASQGGLPYYGTMQFDTADLSRMSESELFDVVLHEMGHVLGIGTLWQEFGLIRGYGSTNPYYIGANATEVYKQMSGRNEYIPVENINRAGSYGSHWRESAFGSELMTSDAGPGSGLPLSIMTVASLVDLGYRVNPNSYDAYRLSAGMASANVNLGGASAGYSSLAASPSVSAMSSHSGSADNNTVRKSRVAGHIDNVVAKHASHRIASPSAARVAAFDSWNDRSNNHQVVRESAEVVRAAFDSAWDDLASDMFRVRMA